MPFANMAEGDAARNVCRAGEVMVGTFKFASDPRRRSGRWKARRSDRRQFSQ
jgi:hypothetical protein